MRAGTFESGRAFWRYVVLLFLMSIVSIGMTGCKSGWTKGNPFAPKPKPASTKTPAEIDGVQLTPPPEKYSKEITKKEDKKSDTSLAQKGKYEKYQPARQEEVAQVAMNTHNTSSTATAGTNSTGGSVPGFNVPTNGYNNSSQTNRVGTYNPASSTVQNSALPQTNGISYNNTPNNTPSSYMPTTNNQIPMNTANQYNTPNQYNNGTYGANNTLPVQTAMVMPNQNVQNPQPTVYNNIPQVNNSVQGTTQSIYANNTTSTAPSTTTSAPATSVPFPTINRTIAPSTTNTVPSQNTATAGGANWPVTGIYGTTANNTAANNTMISNTTTSNTVPSNSAIQGTTATGTSNAFAPGSIGGF